MKKEMFEGEKVCKVRRLIHYKKNSGLPMDILKESMLSAIPNGSSKKMSTTNTWSITDKYLLATVGKLACQKIGVRVSTDCRRTIVNDFPSRRQVAMPYPLKKLALGCRQNVNRNIDYLIIFRRYLNTVDNLSVIGSIVSFSKTRLIERVHG